MTRLDTWTQLQANGLKAYLEIPEASCALPYRRDTKQFKRFIGKQDGFTLDVGCGIEVAGYLEKRNLGRTWGIDPLPTQADFTPMTRIEETGEDISLKDSFFDLVLLAGTLDHVLDPVQVLKEARRVVKPSGRIVVQIGIPNNMVPHTFQLLLLLYSTVFRGLLPKPSVDTEKIRRVVQALPVPDGAVDPFHFRYYTEPEIEALFAEAGLRVTRRRRIPGSTFYELKKCS